MGEFLTGNEWYWRLARTIAQGVIGVQTTVGVIWPDCFEFFMPISICSDPCLVIVKFCPDMDPILSFAL